MARKGVTHSVKNGMKLSKREHFAALALQGLCSGPVCRDAVKAAKEAVAMADALLAALATPAEGDSRG